MGSDRTCSELEAFTRTRAAKAKEATSFYRDHDGRAPAVHCVSMSLLADQDAGGEPWCFVALQPGGSE